MADTAWRESAGASSSLLRARVKYLLDCFDWAELEQWLRERPPAREIDVQATLRLWLDGDGDIDDENLRRLVDWIRMPKWMTLVDVKQCVMNDER